MPVTPGQERSDASRRAWIVAAAETLSEVKAGKGSTGGTVAVTSERTEVSNKEP